MAAVAHNPDFAAKTGIKQSVGRDFMRADKGLGDTFANPAVAARAKALPATKRPKKSYV